MTSRLANHLLACLVLGMLVPLQGVAQSVPLPCGPVAQRVVPSPPRGSIVTVPPRRGAVRRPVEVRVMVIQAGNGFQGYDRGIVHLKRQLGFLGYRGYRLLFQNEIMLRPGTTRRMGLFDGNVIDVTLTSATAERATLGVRMVQTDRPVRVILDTVVSVTRKGTFFVGGPRYDGGVLILPITVWY